jgi:hypothetical protein
MNELEKLKELTVALTSNGYLSDQTRSWEYAFNSVDTMVLIVNPSYKIKFINKPLNDLLGAEEYELLNERASSIASGAIINKKEEVVEVDEKGHVELGISFIEEFNIWIKKKKYVINDDQSRLIGYMFLIEDVTEAEIANRKFHEAYKQMLSMFDSMDELIYVCDPNTRDILFVNKAGKEIFGHNAMGQKCHRYLQGKEKPCEFCTNGKIFGKKHIGKTYSWVFQNKKNSEWYKCIDRAIKWHDGRWVRFELAVNITDQKIQENKINQSLKRLHFMLEAADGYMWEKEFDFEKKMFNFIYADPSFCKDLLGIDSNEKNGDPHSCLVIYNKNLTDVVNRLKKENRKYTLNYADQKTDEHVIEQDRPCEYIEMGYVQQDVKELPKWMIIRVRKTPIFNDYGEITGIIGFANKYTEFPHAIKVFVEKGLVTGSIKKLETGNDESKVYWVVNTEYDKDRNVIEANDFP